MPFQVSTPILTYEEIKVGETVIKSTHGGTATASYNSPYNRVTIKFTPNIQLNTYWVLITKKGAEYGLGVGAEALKDTGDIPAATSHTSSFDINSTLMPDEGEYRISLYAQSSLDFSWDVTYLYFVKNGSGAGAAELFKPKDSDGLEVHVVTTP